MPTGYTADLCDGDVPFADFLLTCARGFGATIHQRDEDLHVRPKHREPSRYDLDAIAKAKERLAHLAECSDDDLRAEWDAKHQASVDSWLKHNEKTNRVAERIRLMIAEVKAWEPPTADHVELQSFMLQQLEETLRFDGSPMDAPTRVPFDRYRADEIEKAEGSLERSTRRHAEEVERCEKTNAWIDALYDSLGIEVTP
jgi:hypothetical protein